MGELYPETNGSRPDEPWRPSTPDEDPICIVGMACRLPGGIKSPSDLWDFLVEKKSAQGKIAPGRFNVQGFYSPSGDKAGCMNVDGAYLLQEDVRCFENGRFGINNLEATYMDPQQRKLLEVTFECFESANVSMEQVSGANIGVYVASFTHDHFLMQMRDPDSLHRYHGTGSGTTLLANRISHVFNLHGPSFALDTACSSSIHCLHAAVTALKGGECDGAMVAASNLILAPEPFVAAMKTGVLSPSSTCQTFDAAADGYGRADGVNAVYLKPLSAALRDGDQVCAVIRGSAVNSNGRTTGVTLPSVDFQEAVIRKAYAKAGIDFSGTDYVECHGTGTAVGDPIELEALGRCFTRPQLIGSVKANLGHSEAASGLTSLIKVALAFQHGAIPPMLGPKNLNPKLRLEERQMKIVTEVEQWPSKLLRRASLNSFGYGGANAHAILESLDSFMAFNTPGKRGIVTSGESDPPGVERVLVLPISAASSATLETRAQQVSELARRCDSSSIGRLAFTLALRVPQLTARTCLISRTASHEAKSMEIDVAPGPAESQRSVLPLAFIFTGQGAQYPNMAKRLLAASPAFLKAIREQDEVLKALPIHQAPDWTLEQAILDPPEVSRVHSPIRSQPLCTAVQIGLVQVMRSWGVVPSAVVGHSSGEIAAAYAAGLLSLPEAILVAYFRGVSVDQVHGKGAMMATGLTSEAAIQLIEEMGLAQEVHVACINAPENVTLSGSTTGLDRLCEEIQARGKFCRRLETGGRAYHSPMIEEAGSVYQDLLSQHLKTRHSLKRSPVVMYSSVGCKGQEAPMLDDTADMVTYWRTNLEKPVHFSRALTSLTSRSVFHLVEVGPHSALKGPIHQTLASRPPPYTPTLIRNADDSWSLKKLAATLFNFGYQLDWKRVNLLPAHCQTKIHDMPPHPWNYSGAPLWFESRASTSMRNRAYPRHELLGSQQLAGSDIDWAWRNVVRLDETPWLRDHKVEEQVVFPAAGYLAMAMEAMSQILGLGNSDATKSSSFLFQNVSFNAALVLVEDESDRVDTELHTTMSRRKISCKNASSSFYDFSISSWKANQAALHCAGSIRIPPAGPAFTGAVAIQDQMGYRTWPMDRWYQKAREEGLCFGPSFQSITNLRADSSRVRPESVCEICLRPSTEYATHPIAIDACLQAAILSAAAGNLSSFKPYLPVFVQSCRIRSQAGDCCGTDASIHVQSHKTGVSSLRADSTLRDSSGSPMVDFEGVRLSRYDGKLKERPDQRNLDLQRHPVMRVWWKPDISHLHSGLEEQLGQYVRDFPDEISERLVPDSEELASPGSITATVGALLDIAGHKNPRMRVLNLGDEGRQREAADYWRRLLGQGTAFQRYRSWTTKDSGEVCDVLVHVDANSTADGLISAAGKDCFIVAVSTPAVCTKLRAAGFDLVTVQGCVLAKRPSTIPSRPRRRVLLLTRQQPSPVVLELATVLRHRLSGSELVQVSIATLGQLDASEFDHETVCISLLEVEHELLATLDPQAMDHLRTLTATVRDLVWLTGAGMLSLDPDANLTLAPGLSRSLMMEQPSLRFVIMDIGRPKRLRAYLDDTCDNIGRVLDAPPAIDDKEFVQHNQVLYVSRLGPDLGVNSLFRRRLGMEEAVRKASLADMHPVRVSIGRPGVTDTIFFQQVCEPSTSPAPGLIDVAVKAVSLNAKDVYSIHGLVETRTGTTALEFAGTVTAVAPDVHHLCPGDRVLVCVPNNLATTQRVPAWQAHKLLPGEDMRDMSTLLVTNVAALYALRDRAHLRAGESVLVHSGAGAFGIAAITMAQRMGATVYTTVGSSDRRDYVVKQLGIPPEHVFSSRDESFVHGVMTGTRGRGVDVVVNSLVGDLMHASWRCVAEYGRFIEVGKRELLDAGKLEMHVFARSTSFTAFDMTEMLYHDDDYYRNLYNSLSKEVIAMYRSGDIKLVPMTIFDAADIIQAYRFFSSQHRIGKVVISFEKADSLIPVAPAKHLTSFDPNKSYLLVGCLGGLGRSLSLWMWARGARNFVFLGRSGADKPQAKELVNCLEHSGARVTVIRGDVACASDVSKAVAACESLGRIGGAVHAAMGLHEHLFARMSNEGWHTSVRPKWAGAWNLHHALEHEELDFFLLTSSMTGTVGVATESNYCAANAFLDAFAYWRRARGLPAVSVGLGMVSEVGYLHENPKIESLLLRRGIQSLNEDEFLQVIDLALCGGQKATATASLMLTGMETLGVRELLSRGFEVTHTVMDDQRSAVLSAALEAGQRGSQSASGASHSDSPTIPWLKDVSSEVATALMAETNAASLEGAIKMAIGKRFSNLILMPLDRIDYTRSFAEFGVDSMIASEFRTWFWNIFKVDVPFLDLLSPDKNLNAVAERVEAAVTDSGSHLLGLD